MSQILHILQKDLRRYAWAWLSLSLFAAIEVFLYGTTAGMLDTGVNQALSMLTSLLGAILFFVVVVMVVQEETLADPDAYWLAKPIARGKLLAEKLIFVGLLLAISIIAHAVILILNGGSARLGYQMLGIFSAFAIWQAQVFLAAQTRSLPRYLLLAVGLMLGNIVLSFSLLFLTPHLNIDLSIGALPSDLELHTLFAIQTTYWLIVGLCILTFMYLRRRFLIAWLLLLPALLGSALLTPSDSFYGLDSRFGMDYRSSLSIEHIRTRGSMQTAGDEFATLEIVFRPDDQLQNQDAWIHFSSVSLSANGKEVEIQPTTSTQRLQTQRDGKHYSTLGHIKQSDLDALGKQIDIRVYLRISLSNQRESARLELNEGATYRADGNRLVVRSIFRQENALTVTLAGFVPEFGFEPKKINTDYEAFGGRFSFGLAQKNRPEQLVDFDLTRSWSTTGKIAPAQLKVQVAQSEALSDYEIIVYSREITDQTHDFVNESNIELIRP